jgi:hypothetical protein
MDLGCTDIVGAHYNLLTSLILLGLASTQFQFTYTCDQNFNFLSNSSSCKTAVCHHINKLQIELSPETPVRHVSIVYI